MKINKHLIFDLAHVLACAIVLLAYWLLREPVWFSDRSLLIGIVLLSLGVGICLGSLPSLVLISSFYCFLYFKIFGKIVNIYSIAIVLILICFLAIYVKWVKEEKNIPLKYRLLGVVILFVGNSFLTKYDRSFTEYANGEYVNLNESPYYCYYHPEDRDAYIECLGEISYLYKELSLETELFHNYDTYEKNWRRFVDRSIDTIANEYNAMFKDKNLIIIQSDSLFDCYLDKELTPTLWQMKNEGIFVEGFSNMIAKRGTNHIDMATNLSLFPLDDVGCYAYLYDNLVYQTTLAGTFKKNNYQTAFISNMPGRYYNRSLLYKTYGYDELITPYDPGEMVIYENWRMVEDIIGFVKANEKTMVYYSPVRNEWIPFDKAERVDKNYPGISDYDRTMIYNLIDLDLGISNLIYRLYEEEMLDNTVFVISGYNNDRTDSALYYANSNEKSADTPLIIYAQNQSGEVFHKTSSSLDLLPTLANLWDIDCDMQNIIGRDIFSSSYRGMQLTSFHEKLKYFWYSDDIAYNYRYGYANPRENQNISDSQKRTIAFDFKQRIAYSEAVFKKQKLDLYLASKDN